jgi:hypothetical protein
METIKIGNEALDLFWEMIDLCYEDDLDDFDKLYDNLLYQAQGLNESIEEAEQDNGEGYEQEFTDALNLAKEIKMYREQLIKLRDIDDFVSKEFEWIYG